LPLHQLKNTDGDTKELKFDIIGQIRRRYNYRQNTYEKGESMTERYNIFETIYLALEDILKKHP